VQLTVREPVKNSRFYLGEALAAHCVAELDGARGAAVTLGDCLERASAAAMLDAGHSGGFPEFFAVESRLLALGDELRRADGERAALVRSTRVNFQILEDRTL
jgi:alpha-D-ribose 1-methylphosphonate 5-triphosphate synthase subunit PhnG